MKKFWGLILVSLFATISLDKAESVQLFDEIFGEGWWDNDKAKEWDKLTLEQNFHHQIDQQNTQIGQIEPNSTDQLGQIEPNSTDQLGQIEPNSTDQLGQIEPNSTDQLGQIEPNSTDQLGQIEPNSTDQLGQIEPNSTDQLGQIEPNSTDQLGQIEPNSTDQLGQIEPNSTDQLGQIEPNSTDQLGQIGPNSTDQLGQIEPNSTDQNPPLTESDHSDNTKNGEEQSENIAKDEQKQKFDQMKAELKRAGFKNSYKNEINKSVANALGLNFTTIYNWKRELGQSVTNYSNNEKFEIVKKLMQIKSDNSAELKRAGFKNSYKHKIDETVAKELGITNRTIYNWKRELGQTKPQHNHNEQKQLMKRYYEIKDKNPKIRDGDIAKMLKIGTRTLIRRKKQFKRQLQPNSVDGLSVEENAAANVQEIENSNSGNI
uniref:Uncharacterized protein n=1 Tax=Globodera rostochiensis TaxID=31243 RepID=A0A914HPB5_GLORO